MDKVVQKTTSKGQITLPKVWRDKFNTTHFVLQQQNNVLMIKPIFLDDPDNYEIIFNAERDNKSKGISAKKLLKIVK